MDEEDNDFLFSYKSEKKDKKEDDFFGNLDDIDVLLNDKRPGMDLEKEEE